MCGNNRVCCGSFTRITYLLVYESTKQEKENVIVTRIHRNQNPNEVIKKDLAFRGWASQHASQTFIIPQTHHWQKLDNFVRLVTLLYQEGRLS